MVAESHNPHAVARVQGSAGVIELTRTRQLNAISGEMVDVISTALSQWASNASISHVVLYTTSKRVFCSGGDIRQVWEHAKAGSHDLGDEYLTREYALNVQIAEFPKPYVSFIDGSVLGGGVGLTKFGSHRVISENALAAMPEMAIGWVPDVGTTYSMARMVGELGRPIPALAAFVGLTGYPMSAADMMFSGLATDFVPSAHFEEAKLKTIEDGPGALLKYRTTFTQESAIAKFLPEIEAAFGHDSWSEIQQAIQATYNESFILAVHDLMETASPTAVVAAAETYAANRRAATLREGISNEYAIGEVLRRDPNFHEGVRAVLVDKDNAPNFSPDSPLEVDPEPYRIALKNARQIV